MTLSGVRHTCRVGSCFDPPQDG